VAVSWNKVVQPDIVQPGFYVAVTDDVVQYVTNETTFKFGPLKPQTLDKSYLKDLDGTYTYQVVSNDLPGLVTRFKNRTLVEGDDNYPMGLYVDTVMQRAIAAAASQYNAMDANQHRADIENAAKVAAAAEFKQEGLDNVIVIKQVMIKNIEIDPKLQDSILRKITAQTDNATKDIEINTADKESQRMAKLTENGNSANYIALLNAQANMKIAEGIAAGRVNTIVVPSDFKGIVNTAVK
jgi:hypothetical protein